MKLSKEQKKAKAVEFSGELEGSSALYFTDYQGLKFTELDDLRTQLKGSKVRYRVVKNAIALHALKDAGFDGDFENLFKGPVGLVWGKDGDPIGAAKTLVEFGKKFEKLRIKAGYVENQWFSADEVARLSMLGSRQELLTRLAGVLQQSIAQIASVLQAPIRDLAFALKAVEDQKKKQPA